MVFTSFPFLTVPDTNIWPLTWFGLVPLLIALRGVSRKRGFWLGALMGFVTNMGGFWWISGVLRDFGHLPEYVVWPLTALNAFFQGLQYALFGYFYARLSGAGRKGADAPRHLLAP